MPLKRFNVQLQLDFIKAHNKAEFSHNNEQPWSIFIKERYNGHISTKTSFCGLTLL